MCESVCVGGRGGGEAAAPRFEESQANDTTVCLNQGSYINLAVSGGSKVLKEGNKVFVTIMRLYYITHIPTVKLVSSDPSELFALHVNISSPLPAHSNSSITSSVDPSPVTMRVPFPLNFIISMLFWNHCIVGSGTPL